MAPQYTDEELLDALQELAHELGKTPTVSDINRRDDMPSRSTYRSRFGTWNQALEAASIEPNQPFQFEREELIETLTDLAEELGRRPTRDELEQHTNVTEAPFRREFGSWGKALQAAGFPRNPRYSDEELISALRDFSNYNGRGVVWTPTKREMDENGPHSSRLYADRFESWTQAVVEAGLDPNTRRTSKTDLLDELTRVAERVGKRPTCRDMNEYGDYSPDPYIRAFGSWNNALREAGFDLPAGGRPQHSFNIQIGDLVGELRHIARKWGRPPTEDEFNEHSRYSSTTYISRFGSWNTALERAGLQPNRETTSMKVDAQVPIDPNDTRKSLEISSAGDLFRLQVGDGLADLRSKMVYEITALEDESISAWPVGYRGDLSRTFPITELKEGLVARSRKPMHGGRQLIHYPDWNHPLS